MRAEDKDARSVGQGGLSGKRRPHRTTNRRPRRVASTPIARAWWLGAMAGVVAMLVLEPTAAQAAAAGGIEEVKDFAGKLTNYITAIAASVAVLFMAISGIRWTMSSGNPMRQSEARNGLVSAAAGLAIALSANVIVSLVIAALQ
jgi:hypothetical protein